MLDPRIYRMSLILPALALVVLAFSLHSQPGASRSNLPPAAYSGGLVLRSMQQIAAQEPARAAGSAGDRALARSVADKLATGANFSVSSDRYRARTPDGTRTLQNVVATRPGSLSDAGSVVVVAPRDARGSPSEAAASGTATLEELSRVLGGETLRRTVVLASISGTEGTAGAIRLADTLPRPIDAVVVLGDVGSAAETQPTVIPWGSDSAIASPRLRNTLAAALRSHSPVRAAQPGVLSQLTHLAFPLTTSGQAPFAANGIPSVELSLSGERGPSAHAAVASAGELTAIGQSILSSISALEAGPTMPGPSAYVVFDGKVVPNWAMSLFVLALIVPVGLTMIDGLARARRRRYLVGRATVTVLSAALPFVLGAAVLLIGGAIGAIPVLPGAAGAGIVPVSGGAIAAVAVAALAALGAGVPVRAAFTGLSSRQGARASNGAGGDRVTRDTRGGGRGPVTRAVDRSDDGTAAAMLLVLCVASVLIWIADPFAAALLVPALHLWLWAIDSDLRIPLPARLLMLVIGLIPTAGLVAFYGHSLGFGPGGLAWEAVLLLGGHIVSLWATLLWSLVLGCLTTAVILVVAAARRPELAEAPVSTVRGPLTYAGPGSLGGTKSALRR